MTTSLAPLIERFFTQRLVHQRAVSPHTIASYRDTLRLLLLFAAKRPHKAPSRLDLAELDAALVVAFLADLEVERAISAATRNLRLTAIRAFFRFVAFEEPVFGGQCQRVLAIRGKLSAKPEVEFLTHPEIDALLAAPDRNSWIGRRDYTVLLLMVQTGLRLSELVGLDRDAVSLGPGAHVRCVGKGRKARSTPLTKHGRSAIQQWLKEPLRRSSKVLFPTVHGDRMSSDAVQLLLAKHVKAASEHCASLRSKRVSPHVLRHSAAMELLQAGVDCSVISLWLGHESTQSTQATFTPIWR